ncbi:AMP-binding protein [Microbacterium sp. X-17]|uniref:AMP-binding protein n=1 Tax=Microbacterium sp. X-17 TaxID=3144404 RepID=UPI0031F4B755
MALLTRTDPADTPELLRRLRAALDGSGPALGFGIPDPAALPDAVALPDVPDGTAVVVTTSGSTGYPKSVVLSAAALHASARASADRIGAGTWVLALAPGYVAGVQVLVRGILAGTAPTVVTGPFDPLAFARAAAETPGPRYASLVPAQLVRLLDAAGDPEVAAALRGFETLLIGGQALPTAVRERALAAGARIVRTYGSSETSGGCVYDGVPLDGVRVRIAADEVLVAGPVLATGYLGEPERTAAAFPVLDGERWYRTGDTGTFADGMLRIAGRLDNVIVSGGVNVSLDRVESIVRTLPGLAEAVVVGVPDARWGEAAVVAVPADAAAPAWEEIRAAVAAELGAPARPARLVVLDALPHLPSGKPDRAAIRRLAAQN